MKVGDKLYCFNDVFYEDHTPFITSGNIYVIFDIRKDKIFIICDESSSMWFTIYDQGVFHYKRYFYNLKESRKEKLKQLSCVNI